MSFLSIARRYLGTFEPLVSMVYFAPEAHEEYGTLGIDPAAGYFCSRSAAMGRASPAVVAAAFYNFNPALVQQCLRWETQDPAAVLAARVRAVRRAYERLLPDEDGKMPDVARAVELLREATTVCRREGRALFAAHAALPWPDDEHVALWHGANLLREYRGDGHIAVLVAHGVDAVEALVLHSPYMELKERYRDFLFGSRFWGDEAYEAAAERLRRRGFLDEERAHTKAGLQFREMLEVETDRLASPPFESLGAERCEELLGLLAPLAERIVGRKGIPRTLTKIAREPSPA